MKKIYFYLIILGFLSGTTLALAESKQSQKEFTTVAESFSLKTVDIAIEGMSCSACLARIKKSLKNLDGVKKVELSLQKRTAEITYDPGKVSLPKLTNTINELGYKSGIPKKRDSSQ